MPVDSETRTASAVEQLLQLRGSGKRLWAEEGGDGYLRRVRERWDEVEGSIDRARVERILERILAHEGQTFQTATGLPFTYSIDGRGMWFFREGRRVNQKLAFSELEKAIEKCPLSTTTEIKEIRDYAYAFGLLKDGRIRGNDW